MAAEEFNQNTIFPIMDESDFEKHNKHVKELIEMFEEYEDGQESIDGFGLRVYENYQIYRKEQEELKKAYLAKMNASPPK